MKEFFPLLILLVITLIFKILPRGWPLKILVYERKNLLRKFA